MTISSINHRIRFQLRRLTRELSRKKFELFDNAPVTNDSYTVTDEDMRHWEEHGWVILKNSVSSAAIDRLQVEIEDFRRKSGGGTDEYGHGIRIGLLHAVKYQSMRVAMNDNVRTFLTWAFGGDPVLFGSLTFDIGSEQEPHIDAAFFYTQPEHCMAGAWTALEDIDPDSGPLFYVDGSHKFDRLYAADALERNPELTQRVQEHRASGALPDLALSNEVYEAYSEVLKERIEERQAKIIPAVINKGDVFIWHGWLIHGGAPRRQRELTRRSMVAHFIRSDVTFWDQHSFFLRGDVLESTPPTQFRFGTSQRGQYIKYEDAVTFDGGDGHFKA